MSRLRSVQFKRLEAIVGATNAEMWKYGRGRNRTIVLRAGNVEVKTHWSPDRAGEIAEWLIRQLTIDGELPAAMQVPVPPHLKR